MTSGITSGSVDLDLLFAPHVTSNAATTGITSSGTDISLLYDVITNPAQYNAGTRIPATAITAIGGINLASIFCGNVSQYSLSTPVNTSKDSGGGWVSPKIWTHTITVTFSSAAALTDYFFYGGRIQLSPTQGAGTTADNTLATMFSNMGTLIIYDAGHYRTGTGGTISNASTGGSNIGTTPVSLYNTTDGFPYSGSTYNVSMVANAAPGSATVLTITTVLDITTYAGIDTYTGTYTSNVQQRNHPTQTVPTFSGAMNSVIPVVTPVADFTSNATTGPTPLIVNFTDTSTNLPTSWLWDFGDSNTSTAQNPSHTYNTATSPGQYFTVSLTATNAAGSNTVTKTSYIYVTSTVVTIPITVNTSNYNVRSAAVAAGWDQITPLNVAVNVSSGVIISSDNTSVPALTIDGSYPVGSVISITNAGYIIGMGGAGGNGNTQVWVATGPKTGYWQQLSPYTSGLAGGPALVVSATVPGNLTVTVDNTSGIIGGGGGGGGGAYSLNQTTSPGGGGGRTGSTNSAGGGGGYGSYPGTFSGAGAALVPSGHGNSGAGGNWGSGGGQGSAWPGDWIATNGGAGGNATIGNAYITWIAVGTRYGTLG